MKKENPGILKKKIFTIKNTEEFNELCLKIFLFQSEQNPVYRQYCNYLGIKPSAIKNVLEIPFLPVRFFREHKIISTTEKTNIVFESSTTSGQAPSRHHVTDLSLYEISFIKTFRTFYGDPSDYCFLCLLPSYLERSGSSLIYMTNKFLEISKYKESGYYLYNHEDLHDKLIFLSKQGIPTILLGVSFALLDFALNYSFN